MGRNKSKGKQHITLPPDLPPEISDDEILVSEEDEDFVNHNREYTAFLESLDKHSIDRQVTRVEGVSEGTLEALYEQRRRKALQQKEQEPPEPDVETVDALPIRTLDGQLQYRTYSTPSNPIQNGGDQNQEEGSNAVPDRIIIKKTKAERREMQKKIKKEAKRQGKEVPTLEAMQATPQAAVLAEVKEDLTAEEALEKKKHNLAEIGMSLLSDPEGNIKRLKEMLSISADSDQSVVKLGLLSLLAVFKDIIPGYRIRLPTEKELEMKVSKEVKKIRFYESTILSAYKSYLQKLLGLEKKHIFHRVAVRCICSLLDAVPHFNFRLSLLTAVVKNLSSTDDAVRYPANVPMIHLLIGRKLCCTTIKSLFTNDGKHGGEATIEAVRMIANLVKAHDCQLHPDAIEVFMCLSFDEDIRKPDAPDTDTKVRNNRYKKQNTKDSNPTQENDRKKSKKELMTRIREEVAADYRAVTSTQDVLERRRMQTETLSAVFETYFRVLKHAMRFVSSSGSSEAIASLDHSVSAAHPLLAPCLNGLGKFSHLIDMDYIGDLISYLKQLASRCASTDSQTKNARVLTVSERLRCCIVAFKVMRSNLDALNVDLKDFSVQLYNLILEYRPGRDQAEVLTEALKLMLCDDRQHDMQKTAAFVKRLSTFSLCVGSAESMAALVTLKHLIQKNVKCRNLLENDAGGGSVSGDIAKYQPYALDPNLSGALSSVLWELNLLSKHYHPAVATMSSSILSMNSGQNQVTVRSISPQHAFLNMSLQAESFELKGNVRKLNGKRKREAGFSAGATVEPNAIAEDEINKKLSSHFKLIYDIKENERLRKRLYDASSCLHLHNEYKKQKRDRKLKSNKRSKN